MKIYCWPRYIWFLSGWDGGPHALNGYKKQGARAWEAPMTKPSVERERRRQGLYIKGWMKGTKQGRRRNLIRPRLEAPNPGPSNESLPARLVIVCLATATSQSLHCIPRVRVGDTESACTVNSEFGRNRGHGVARCGSLLAVLLLLHILQGSPDAERSRGLVVVVVVVVCLFACHCMRPGWQAHCQGQASARLVRQLSS